MPHNTRVLIASVPNGPLGPEHFVVDQSAAPECGDGQVLCRTVALTIGAGQRAGLQGSASYAGAPKAGAVMGGTGVARVEASQATGFAPGDLVVGPTGWQTLSSHAPSALRKVPAGADPALHLGVLGTNGLTAYFGLLDLGRPQAGEHGRRFRRGGIGRPRRRPDRETRRNAVSSASPGRRPSAASWSRSSVSTPR